MSTSKSKFFDKKRKNTSVNLDELDDPSAAQQNAQPNSAVDYYADEDLKASAPQEPPAPTQDNEVDKESEKKIKSAHTTDDEVAISTDQSVPMVNSEVKDPNESMKLHPHYWRNIDPEHDLHVRVSSFTGTGDKKVIVVKLANKKLKQPVATWLTPYTTLNNAMLYPFGNWRKLFPPKADADEKKEPTKVFLADTQYTFFMSDDAWNAATATLHGKDPEMLAYVEWCTKLHNMVIRFFALNKSWSDGDPLGKHRIFISSEAIKIRLQAISITFNEAVLLLKSGSVPEAEYHQFLKRAVNKKGEPFPFEEYEKRVAAAGDVKDAIKAIYKDFAEFFECKPVVTVADVTDQDVIDVVSSLFLPTVKPLKDKTTMIETGIAIGFKRRVWSYMNKSDVEKRDNGDPTFSELMQLHPVIRKMANLEKQCFKYNILPLETSTGAEEVWDNLSKFPRMGAVCVVLTSATIFFDCPQDGKPAGIRFEPQRIRFYKDLSTGFSDMEEVSSSAMPVALSGGDALPRTNPKYAALLMDACVSDDMPLVEYKKN